MRRILLAAIAALALTLAGSGNAADTGPTILVKFRNGVDGAAVVQSLGDRVVGQTVTHTLLIEVRAGVSAAADVSMYTSRSDVLYAELNSPVQAALGPPNDPSYSSQWALSTINALDGWRIVHGSYGVTGGPIVGVVDTGIDSTNPDLADGRVLTGSGANCLSGTCVADPAADDSPGHGTHVAGIAAGATSNGHGVAGVAFDSPVLPVKVLDSTGVGSTAAVANGIIWAADHGARVINASISTSAYSATLCDAVAYAISSGALVVAAAGNDATFGNEYPAACPGVVGVAATDQSDLPASFSNYGYPDVFVAAPGVSILSTLRGDTYGAESGTSMAAPFVSGLAAQLIGQDPSRTAADVKRLIAKTAAKVGTSSYSGDRFNVCGGSCTWSSFYGYGRIDVASALTYGSTPHFSVGVSSSTTATAVPGASAAYTIAVGADTGYNGMPGLSVSGLPAGATASFSPSSVSAPGSSQLTIATSSTTPLGTYALTISGSDGTSTEATSATLSIVAPDFSVSASPTATTVLRGRTTTIAVSVGADLGFTGSVALSASGAPSGVTASFVPSSLAAPGSSTLTLTASTSATLGTFTVTIKGVQGTKTHTTTIALTVAIPDFTVSGSPSSTTILQGQTATFSVAIGVLNGFTGNIAMSVTGYPSGATVTWSLTSVPAPGSATLNVRASATGAPGTYTLTISGKSAARVIHTTTVRLVVNPVGDFTFTENPGSLSVNRGSSGLAYVYLVGQGGFYCTVALNKSGLPTGVTGTWSKSSLLVSGTSTFSTYIKLAAASTTIPGTYTVTLTATCGPIVHTAAVALTVN